MNFDFETDEINNNIANQSKIGEKIDKSDNKKENFFQGFSKIECLAKVSTICAYLKKFLEDFFRVHRVHRGHETTVIRVNEDQNEVGIKTKNQGLLIIAYKYLKSKENESKINLKKLNPFNVHVILEYDSKTSYNISKRVIMMSNDVETNPGPVTSKDNLFVATYNVQGCHDFKKVKRLFAQLKKLPYSSNCIFNLQETHITTEDTQRFHWKGGSVHSPGTSSSAGVAILYNSNYFDEIISKNKDIEGRMCTLTARKEEEVYLFINLYAPNNHYVSEQFFERVSDEIDKTLNIYPLANIVMSGDFNFVFNPYLDLESNLNKKLKLLISLITL